MEVLCKNTQETEELARRIAPNLFPGSVVLFFGDLGSGKTTLIRFLVGAMGFNVRVQSPTFVLHREYFSGDKKINHFDLYRLSTEHEVSDSGILEAIYDSGAVNFVEWPEKLLNLLGDQVSPVIIEAEFVDENTRKYKIQNLD